MPPPGHPVPLPPFRSWLTFARSLLVFEIEYMPLFKGVLSVTTEPVVLANSVGVIRNILLVENSYDRLKATEPSLLVILTDIISRNFGSAGVNAMNALLSISTIPKNREDLLDTPSLVSSIRQIVLNRDHPARDAAFITLFSLANSCETACRLTISSDLSKVMTEIATTGTETESARKYSLTFLGNLVHWGDSIVLEALQRQSIRSLILPLASLPGYIGLRATMIVVLLNDAEISSPSLSPSVNFDLLASDSVIDQVIEFFENVLSNGRAFGMVWDISEPLAPLLRIVQRSSPTNVRKLATPRLTQLTVLAIEKSPDPWTTQMGLELLEELCSFHRSAHTTHSTLVPTCPLCIEPAKNFCPLHAHLITPTSLVPLLHQVKMDHVDHPKVFNLARKALVIATEDADRWLAFCMGSHARLGKDSHVQTLPPDLLPRILDFL
eukprot:c16394_g1_i3.p1 GENE.c16394_g1_i3~~c16394_g1_i3.p1  ORF type:complete len:439 (-),score=65.55 c16394_g1_i3:111-1427(-)